jgi:DeoR family fructose operon transcriptional repressor
MMKNASNVALLTDSSKAESDAFMRFAMIDELDCLITDNGMPDDIMETARRAGVTTIVASTADKNKHTE